MKKNGIQILYAFIAFLAVEGIQYSVIIILRSIYGAALGIYPGLGKGTEELTDQAPYRDFLGNSIPQDILYMISVSAVLFCGIIFFFWYRYEVRGEIRGSLHRAFTVKNMIHLILLGVGCQFFITGIISIVLKYFPRLYDNYTEQMGKLTGGNAIIVLFLIVFIAPVTEELIFRGVILYKASRALPFFAANILQAVLFGVYHMNVVQGIYASFMGFVLGLIYQKYRNISVSILLHIIINSSALLLVLFPQHMIAYYILTLSGGVFAISSLIAILHMKGNHSA